MFLRRVSDFQFENKALIYKENEPVSKVYVVGKGEVQLSNKPMQTEQAHSGFRSSVIITKGSIFGFKDLHNKFRTESA